MSWNILLPRSSICRRRTLSILDPVTQALALNLSYILHEPSTSPEIHAAVHTLQTTRRRVQRATRRLASRADEAVIPCIVPHHEHALHLLQSTAPRSIHLLTLTLGAWQLLPRLIALHAYQSKPTLWLLERLPMVGPARDRPFLLFRAPTRLALPEALLDNSVPVWFATAAFRPGWQSVLLHLCPLPEQPAERLTTLGQSIEEVLRNFWPQWYPERALWPAPAEAVLPEFRDEG
jgi:hypothetical protein